MKVRSANVFAPVIDGRRPVILELETDEGIAGLGEAALAYGAGATAAVALTAELVERFVIGRDASRIEAIWSTLYDHTFWAKGGGPVVFAAISAIEQCLWDIKGRAFGVPVCELLGGRVRDEVRLYCNGWSFRAETPKDMALAAERAARAGYDALKLYPLGRPIAGDPHGRFVHVDRREFDRPMRERAVAMVAAVRDAVGPGVDIMCDMSGELTPDAMIQLGRALEPYDLMFLEEPVDPFDTDALKLVADRLDIPIAVGERLYTRYGFRPVMEKRAAAILQPDIGATGGLMEAKKIAAMAEAYSMRIAPHVCAGPVASAAALQLDACIANFLIQEIYPFRAPAHFALVDEPVELQVVNGRAKIPSRPGFGVDLVRTAIEPHLAARIG